jgi:hypothetical protein
MAAAKSRSTEIIIALIGLVGVIATALLSNWDKIGPDRGEVTGSYQGYKPTGIFETELRYFLEITGARRQYEEGWKYTMADAKIAILSKHPEKAEQVKEEWDNMVAAYKKSMPTFDEWVAIMLPVYSDHYSVAELQKLNKLYSTGDMQNMFRKDALISKELDPILLLKIAEATDAVDESLEKSKAPDGDSTGKVKYGPRAK